MEELQNEFTPAIQSAVKLAHSINGVGVEKFALLKREFLKNLSEQELLLLRGLVSILENPIIK